PAGVRDRPLGLPARDGAEDPRGARAACRVRLGARRVRAPRAGGGRRCVDAALPAPRGRSRRVLIDTHAHLGDDAREVLERAREAGVTKVIAVATTLAGARAALELADEHEGVYASLGIHPHEAGTREAANVEHIAALLAHPKAVA